MTEDVSELETDLQRLTRRWESITDVPERPTSTMNIIEYGLGKQRRAEVYINRLLCYLLDPAAPHGMEAEFLTAVLQGLPDALDFDVSYQRYAFGVEDRVFEFSGEPTKSEISSTVTQLQS